MRKTFNSIICLVLSTATIMAQSSSGGSYKITSTVVAGGGGVSSGSGNKSIEGTTGQLAAGGPQTNGTKSFSAGFWHAAFQESVSQGDQTPIQFSATNYQVQEQFGALGITVIRSGDTSLTSRVTYETENLVANERSDFEYSAGVLEFGPGETTKSIIVLINEDMYEEQNETFKVVLSKPVNSILGSQSTATVTIIDDVPEQPTNPIGDAQSFVHVQYHDFLNREPDTAGLEFWTNEITSCGNDQTCIDIKRVNVSAAFFLSIEFQQTGYVVIRTNRSAYGSSGNPAPMQLHDFLVQTQRISNGVIVNQPGWQQVLEANKQAYFRDFVRTASFEGEYPIEMTPTAFVDFLYGNSGITPTPSERQAAIDQFGGATQTLNEQARVTVLRMVVENSSYVASEFNRAFVLMQYFGYLRRNPVDPPEPGLNLDGYNFWLNKLNQANGNFVDADMVKAFIISGEYRQRFGSN